MSRLRWRRFPGRTRRQPRLQPCRCNVAGDGPLLRLSRPSPSSRSRDRGRAVAVANARRAVVDRRAAGRSGDRDRPADFPERRHAGVPGQDGELTQVAVMKPGSGDWTILTHKRHAGNVNEISWAPDGNTIYFDRWNGAPAGVFSVPALGGDERLVLEDAMDPAALPDGSVLVVRRNAERMYRLFRFWPDSGRLLAFPIQPAGSFPWRAQVFPGGEVAVILGTDVSQTPPEGAHLYVLELTSGHVRRLPTGVQDDQITAIAVTRDGQSVLAAVRSGNLVRVVVIPSSGRAAPRTVLTLTATVSSVGLDVGPDGSIYADQWETPLAIVRFPVKGGHAETIVVPPGPPDGSRVSGAVLPDGRIAVVEYPGGHPRLVVIEAGKAPSRADSDAGGHGGTRDRSRSARRGVSDRTRTALDHRAGGNRHGPYLASHTVRQRWDHVISVVA